ncbi:hypothetical protein BLNAU_8686 [Blattamonas nauphoetae]|uniref:Uncharacterized protein n=1 Tax=Blattamonas nauphoetae TaxID=2049346 RepID=A0ABQ9XXW5_9EUKA|nr:hypothetical protein BLNAU_8686 [Blattamonas nauphoetae]
MSRTESMEQSFVDFVKPQIFSLRTQHSRMESLEYLHQLSLRKLHIFSDCNSTIGGCICSSISTTQSISFMLDDSIIESSHAEKGGAIAHEVSLSSTSSFSVINSNFTRCSSSSGGSFMFIIHEYLSISINHTIFTSSLSTANGGCIAIKQYQSASNFPFSVKLSDVSISDCSSEFLGGFLYLEQDQNDFEGESVISCHSIYALNCSSGYSGGFFSLCPTASVKLSVTSSTLTSLSKMTYGGFIHCVPPDTLVGQPSTFLTLEDVKVTKFDSESSGALICFEPSSVAMVCECVVKNCHFSRDSFAHSSVICQLEGTLRMESTMIVEHNPLNHAMLDLSPNTKLSLNMCQLVNTASRTMEQNYRLISGPLGPDNFVECTEVIFSANGPTCAGYVVTFDSLPNKVGELFVSCVDTSTESSFSSVADKTGNHTFSINSENREIFVNEESGRDWNLCGFQSNPCSSIHFSSRVSSRSAFSISAVGSFSPPRDPVVLASPCMRLTSGPSTEESRATLKFSLSDVPILQAPNNPFELSHLVFILETDRNDGVFFRAGQSSTHVRDILVNYAGQHRVSLFFLPHTSTSKFVIDLDVHDLPLNNLALFTSDSSISVIDSSSFEDLVFSGSSTFLGPSKNTIVRSSSFTNLQSTEPFFRLSFSTLDLSVTQFKFCQVESEALFVVDKKSVLSVFSSTFQSCTGREAGVALFTDKADTASDFNQVTMISNRAHHKEANGQAMTSLFGNDLTIRGNPQLVNIIRSRSSSFFPRVVVGDSDNVEVVDMFAQDRSVFHLVISGTDSNECGSEIDACCTLQYTIGVTNETNLKEEMTTLRPYGPFRDVSVFVGRRSILLHGRGLTEFEAPDHHDGVMLKIDDSSVVLRQIVFRMTKIDCGSFVSSTKSDIELDDCTVSLFIPSHAMSSTNSPLHSLFAVSSGSLLVSRLQSFNFQSTSLSSTLLVVDRANFKLKNTTLSSLSADSDSGLMCGTVQHTHFDLDKVRFEELQTTSNCGILNLTVIDTGSVSLTETTFFNMNITSPFISLTLSSSPSVTTQTSLVVDISSIHIKSCHGTEIAGSVLLIDNPHNIQWILAHPERGMDLNEIEWDSFAEKRGSDETRSLFISLIPPLPKYIVKESVNNDVIDCGSEQLPCSSIEFAVGRIHPHRTNAIGVVLNSPVDLKEQLSDKRCSILDGSRNTLTIVQRVVDSGAAIVVRETFELVSVDVALPPNSSSLGRDAGIIECLSGSLSVKQVTVLQTTMTGLLHRVIVLAVDTNVTISDSELSRLSTEDGIISLRYTNNTIPNFLFHNLSIVNCQPLNAVRIALAFSAEHSNVKLSDHFEKMTLDWKHPEWYSLTVGEKQASFLFDVVVHPAIWGGLGVAGLLALLILPWLLCTPAMFPIMMCCRHVRNKSTSSNHSCCCKCLLPDGGHGLKEHDPWDAIALLNGIPNEYRYATITDSKMRQQTSGEELEQQIDAIQLTRAIAADGRNNFRISDADRTSHTVSMNTARQKGKRKKNIEIEGPQHAAGHKDASTDSDSEDVLNSSDVSEESV